MVGASPSVDYRGLRRDQAARYLIAHQSGRGGHGSLAGVAGEIRHDLARRGGGAALPAQGASSFGAALAQVAGRDQTEVVVLWPLQEIFQEIAAEPAIAKLRDQLAADPDAATVLPEPPSADMVQEGLAQRRAELSEGLLPALCPNALDVVTNPLLDDSMVINVALLLDEAGRRELGEQVERLDADFSGRLTFRCIGPLPPYSFATVELQIPSFEAVDAARRLLGLGATATLGEIRRAYRQLASQVHPDHRPAADSGAAEMAALSQAHDLLHSYGSSWAQQQQQDSALDSPCCFEREAVEQTLLVRVRRQEMLP